ncbi:hypothetical protein [Kaarinaea lacus]
MKWFTTRRLIPSVFLVLVAATFSVQADSDYDGQVPATPKAFYDVNLTDADSMKVFLGVINDTYNLFISKGAPPSKIKFVISLRGLAVTFVTEEYVLSDPDMNVLLDSLMANGVRIEACEISCEWLLPPNTPLYAGIVLIDNAFASSIWYQTKGYAMINID